MRTAFLLLAFVLCWPDAAGAEGVLHPPAEPRAPSMPQHDCLPGQNATDPGCCAARLEDCRAACQHDFRANGDMLYLRHCRLDCEQEAGRCREGGR